MHEESKAGWEQVLKLLHEVEMEEEDHVDHGATNDSRVVREVPVLMTQVFSAKSAPGLVSMKPLLRQAKDSVEEARWANRGMEVSEGKGQCPYFVDSFEGG